MCLIIEQQAGDALTGPEIADIYSRNREGFGVMWLDGTEVKCYRYLPQSAAEAIALYQPFAYRHVILHWRMCTSGPVTLDMAHPFDVNDDMAVMHNGVLSGLGDATESDTLQFVRDVLRPMLGHDLSALERPAVQHTIEAAIEGSVLVFARPTGYTWQGRKPLDGAQFGKPAGRLYSNTYAWSAPSIGRGYDKKYGGWGRYVDDDVTPARGYVRTVQADGRAVYRSADPDPVQRDMDDASDLAWDAWLARQDAKRDGANDDVGTVEPWESLDRECTLVDAGLAELADWLSRQLETLDAGLSWELSEYAASADIDGTSQWLEWACDQAIDTLQQRCQPGFELIRSGDTLACEYTGRGDLADRPIE